MAIDKDQVSRVLDLIRPALQPTAATFSWSTLTKRALSPFSCMAHATVAP